MPPEQRGFATATRQLVEAVKPHKARIGDTRKTTPGLRALEKYAVRAGGGVNHRFGLDNAMLIKDNHIAVAGGVTAAVTAARKAAGHMLKIEVEVDSLAQLRELLALPAALAPDAVLLDNMNAATLREAVDLIGGRFTTEASKGTASRPAQWRPSPPPASISSPPVGSRTARQFWISGWMKGKACAFTHLLCVGKNCPPRPLPCLGNNCRATPAQAGASFVIGRFSTKRDPRLRGDDVVFLEEYKQNTNGNRRHPREGRESVFCFLASAEFFSQPLVFSAGCSCGTILARLSVPLN